MLNTSSYPEEPEGEDDCKPIDVEPLTLDSVVLTFIRDDSDNGQKNEDDEATRIPAACSPGPHHDEHCGGGPRAVQPAPDDDEAGHDIVDSFPGL